MCWTAILRILGLNNNCLSIVSNKAPAHGLLLFLVEGLNGIPFDHVEDGCRVVSEASKNPGHATYGAQMLKLLHGCIKRVLFQVVSKCFKAGHCFKTHQGARIAIAAALT